MFPSILKSVCKCIYLYIYFKLVKSLVYVSEKEWYVD